MESFVNGLPGRPHEILEKAIQGRGAFRRFKDRIRTLGLEQAWYGYQEDEYKRHAIRWCEENGVEYEE